MPESPESNNHSTASPTRRNRGADVSPVTLEEVWQGKEVSFKSNGFEIVVPWVSPLAAGLLPHSLVTRLKSIENLQGEPFHSPGSIRTIGDLIALIRHFGPSSISYYHAIFRHHPGVLMTYDEDGFSCCDPGTVMSDSIFEAISKLK